MMSYSRILIIKPSSLGDIVHALPTAAALRRAFPTASLTWIVKQQWAEILEGNPDLDRVWPVDVSMSGWFSAIRAARRSQFDVVVDLQGLFRTACFAWLSGAPVRVGFATAREGSPWFYTRRVRVPSLNGHAVDRYLLLAKALGASAAACGVSDFPLQRDPAADAQVEKLMLAEGLSGPAHFVVMNPGARWPTKRWPPALFASVADGLQQQGIRVVLIGDRSEVSDEVIAMMRTMPIDLAAKTSLKDLVALLRRAPLLITNDSGPMHLAAALHTPVLALFGPTDPRKTGPYGTGHVVLRSGVPCSPCLSRRCTNQNTLECLITIRPQQVIEASLRLLEQPLDVIR